MVAIEPPRQPPVLALLRQSDEFTLALYPSESSYLLDVSDLERPGVSVFVARTATGAGSPTVPDPAPASISVQDLPALGMAALVERGDGSAEIKRVFVAPDARGQGIASLLLSAVQAHAQAAGVLTLQLETGPYQPEAIALYRKFGFEQIPNFGQYVGDPLSFCMEKTLAAHAG